MLSVCLYSLMLKLSAQAKCNIFSSSKILRFKNCNQLLVRSYYYDSRLKKQKAILMIVGLVLFPTTPKSRSEGLMVATVAILC